MNSRLIAQQSIGSIDGNGMGNFIPTNPSEAPSMLNTLFSQIIGFLTITAGLAFLIYFILGALNWVTAGGDTKKVDDAKHYMTNGAIGMIIIVAAYSIIWIVGEVLGFKILDPGNTFNSITGASAGSGAGGGIGAGIGGTNHQIE